MNDKPLQFLGDNFQGLNTPLLTSVKVYALRLCELGSFVAYR